MSNVKIDPSEQPGAIDVATDDISGVHHPFFKIEYGADGIATPVDANNPLPAGIFGSNGVQADVDSLGHFSIVAHSHEEGGYVLFEKDIAATADFIFVDLSDTANYPHDNASWIHVGNLLIDVAATSNADYEIHLGFLSNVDGTDGDFHQIYGWEGNKTTGRQINAVIATSPESVKMRASSTLGPIDANNIAFQTDVNLASSKDPATADTPSGNGDVVIRVIITAGSINLSLGMTYHSH